VSVLGSNEDERPVRKRRVAQRVTNLVTDSLGESNDLHSQPRRVMYIFVATPSMMAGMSELLLKKRADCSGGRIPHRVDIPTLSHNEDDWCFHHFLAYESGYGHDARVLSDRSGDARS
jgi:hypothetical protein